MGQATITWEKISLIRWWEMSVASGTNRRNNRIIRNFYRRNFVFMYLIAKKYKQILWKLKNFIEQFLGIMIRSSWVFICFLLAVQWPCKIKLLHGNSVLCSTSNKSEPDFDQTLPPFRYWVGGGGGQEKYTTEDGKRTYLLKIWYMIISRNLINKIN